MTVADIFNLVDLPKDISVKTEILAGLTVALALIPEALAFSMIAGVSPSVGLYSAFVMGLLTSILGGRPAMISGATGAVAVGLAALTKNHGVEYIFVAAIFSGAIQVSFGAFNMAKVIRFVSFPVMIGFVNGLAVILFLSQLSNFSFDITGHARWLTGSPLFVMTGLVAATMAIIVLLPRITKKFPAPLLAIVSIFLIVKFLGISTATVRDIAPVHGGLPSFHIANVPISFETLKIILPYSIVMAGVGLIESLLTLKLIDKITGTRGKSNKEAIAQGLANIISGLFGGMGGCAMTGQSLLNMSAGGRSSLSGIVAAAFLLFFIVYAAPLVEAVPIAALTGVMIMISISTFNWQGLNAFRNARPDLIISLLVSLIAIFSNNLAMAVLVGSVISAFIFTSVNSNRFSVSIHSDGIHTKYYNVYGNLFYASVSTFDEAFNVLNDPAIVVIDFKDGRIGDTSGVETLKDLVLRYNEHRKKIQLRNVNVESQALLRGQFLEIVS